MPLPLFKTRQKKEEPFIFFLEHGSSLMEELICSFGARYKNPILCLTAKELISATNNFIERIPIGSGYMYGGVLKGEQILVKRLSNEDVSAHIFRGPIRDVAVSSQMSHLKNILKLKGCCLGLKFPALVYEFSGTELLSDFLHLPNNDEKVLSWKPRLHIAKGIANALAYLHTSFPTPIIYRGLEPSKVFIAEDCVPKMFDFSCSIRLPPGESEVEDVVVGTWGYADPEYVKSGIVTDKIDVYSFGVLLLVLLTGKKATFKNYGGEITSIVDYVEYHIAKDQIKSILDSNIWEEEKEKYEKQLLAFLNLAMKCTLNRGEDRLDMIQVAKELHMIEKS